MACEGAVGGPSVFVTVGTTSFPALVAAVTSPAALEQLYERGIRCLVVQYGREKWPTDAPPLDSVVKGVHVRCSWMDALRLRCGVCFLWFFWSRYATEGSWFTRR